MIDAWNSLYSFYTNSILPSYNSLMNSLIHNQYLIYILIAVIVGLSIYRKITKNLKLIQWLDFVVGMIVVLLLLAGYHLVSPKISSWFDSLPKSSSSSTKSTTGTNSTTTNSSSSNSSRTTQKQLYYSVGCYDCYADSCVRNGYSYGGYDVNYYNYIRGICQNCRCSSYRAQSLWR